MQGNNPTGAFEESSWEVHAHKFTLKVRFVNPRETLAVSGNELNDEPDPTKEPRPTTTVEAVDSVISSLWGQDMASVSRGRLSDTGRPSGHSDNVLPLIRLVLSPSPDQRPGTRDRGQDQGPRTKLLVARFDRRTGAVLPPVPQPGKDEPDLASMSLAVAMMGTEWVHACRWHRTVRPEWSGRAGNPVRRRRAVIK